MGFNSGFKRLILNLSTSCDLRFGKNVTNLNQGYKKFLKISDPPQNIRCQKSGMKQLHAEISQIIGSNVKIQSPQRSGFRIQINHQLDGTISPVYYSTFIYSSACFGLPHAYHQELNNCSSSLWFYLRSVVVAVLLVVVGPAGPTTTNSTAITMLQR